MNQQQHPLNSSSSTNEQRSYDATETTPLADLFTKPVIIIHPPVVEASTPPRRRRAEDDVPFSLPYRASRLDSDSTIRITNGSISNTYQQKRGESSSPLLSRNADDEDVPSSDGKLSCWPFHNISLHDLQITILGSFLSVLYNTVFCLALVCIYVFMCMYLYAI